MAVDTTARIAVANAMEDYLAGRIDNETLNRQLLAGGRTDTACYEIYGAVVDVLYSIWHRHQNKGDDQLTIRQERMVRRWIQFLRSTAEWPRPSHHRSNRMRRLLSELSSSLKDAISNRSIFENEFWPYQTADEWKRFT